MQMNWRLTSILPNIKKVNKREYSYCFRQDSSLIVQLRFLCNRIIIHKTGQFVDEIPFSSQVQKLKIIGIRFAIIINGKSEGGVTK